MINFVLLAFSACLLIYIDASAYTEAILLAAVIVAIISNRSSVNGLHLALILFFIISVETMIQASQVLVPSGDMLNVWKNTIIYSTYLAFDLIALITMMLRPAISRTILPDRKAEIYMTPSEILLISVYVLFIGINLLALGENFIRNLEHLGVSEEFAKQFWSWDWVYYSYPTMKRVVIAIQLFSIFMLIKEPRHKALKVA
ncbi:hypothetical protein [Pseudoalteromonas sp. DY56-GL79]|uniref:hypothetical protein n=1 Tax=Pseudoalteromonas sp. DY56-GL79 TaxID=2967131 RepID=UPI00352A1FF6